MDPSEGRAAVEGTSGKGLMLVKEEFVIEMKQLVYLLGKGVIATFFSQYPCWLIKAEKGCNIGKEIQNGILGGEQNNNLAKVPTWG